MDSIPEDKKKILKKDLNDRVKNAVKIIMFTQEHECKLCESKISIAGPLWIGKLFDKEFVQNMLDENSELETDKIY